MIHAFIKEGCFQDSVSLMIISRKLSESEDVDDVSIVMDTLANRPLLRTTGFQHNDSNQATPNDICTAIRIETADESTTQTILRQLDESLQRLAQTAGGSQVLLRVRRWESMCQKLPEASMTLIPVADEYAAKLTSQVLDHSLNIMMFPDNVTLGDEINLKRCAQDKGLLVTGLDCGTAMIAGTPLAFTSVMLEGNIDMIGAPGIGIQELCSQIALAGEGTIHATGLGGRDLSAEVGGTGTLTALEILSADDKSQVLAFVSKPPAKAVRQRMATAIKATSKPAAALFLGYISAVVRDENVWFAATLDDTAYLTCLLVRVTARHSVLFAVGNGIIRGLYTGGTLVAEAAGLLAGRLDVPADAEHHHGVMLDVTGHQTIDLGDDFYIVGRPRPMIDPALRNQFTTGLSSQPQARVLLMDVVIGYGATADPAASPAQTWQKACAARDSDQPLFVIATATGTRHDPQCHPLQTATLEDTGIVMVNSLPEVALPVAELTRPVQPLSHQSAPALLEKVAVTNAGSRSFALDLQAAERLVVHYQ